MYPCFIWIASNIWSIAHNENLNPLLNLLINFISGISAPQILTLKDDYTLCFSNFLVIDFSNSSTNSRVVESKRRQFDTTLFSIAPTDTLLSKIYKPLKQVYVDTYHHFGFLAISNT